MWIKHGLLAALALMTAFQAGCMTAYKESVGGDTSKAFSRIYFTDFNTAWQSVLDGLKSSRLDVSNREGGFIQTRWAENTSERKFLDSFGNADAYLKAQYRLKVTLAKGVYQGRQSVKISVIKEQLVQRDLLEGWKPVESDSIFENTFLYRIERLITIRTRLAKLEEQRTRQAIQKGAAAGQP